MMYLQQLSGLGDTSALDLSIAVYRKQHSGSVIYEIQRRITVAGFPVAQDGIWGRKTEAAYRQYWAAQGGSAGGGSGGTGGGGRVVIPEIVGNDAGGKLPTGSSWKDFFQSVIAEGVTYLKRSDVEKKQRAAAAAGVDTTIEQNPDGTYTLKKNTDWKKIMIYGAVAAGGVLLILALTGRKRGGRARR